MLGVVVILDDQRIMPLGPLDQVLAFTIAGEIGEIERFASPEKLTGYTGLCPRDEVAVGRSERSEVLGE